MALAAAGLPILGLRISREGRTLTGTVTLVAHPLNLAVALVSGLTCAMLIAYFVTENLLGKGA